ncbi:MAG: hypothetical protein ABJ081_04030 [Hyphomicrobiales bacterium]
MNILRGLFGIVSILLACGLLIFTHENYTSLEIDLGPIAPIILLVIGFGFVMFGLITFLKATR